jgi:serine/arginine repetitive matrix protein 2
MERICPFLVCIFFGSWVYGADDICVVRVQPVFSRPGPVSRSRSSTCTSSSGADTPPLSAEEGSQSEGSQSSIDLSSVSVILSNAAHPMPTTAQDRTRARGHGHRRRITEARTSRISRTSMYETIEEELTSISDLATSPHSVLPNKTSDHDLTGGRPPVIIVDPETPDQDSPFTWDDENGITELRKYYTLREEAEYTVTDSKRIWLDTPFSIYSLQSKQTR